MDIEKEITRLKERVSAFKPIEKYQDLAIEAEAYFELSHQLEKQAKHLPDLRMKLIYKAITKHLIDECMNLLTALWNALPPQGSHRDVIEKWEEKIGYCRRNFEYARELYLFVIEMLGIAKNAGSAKGL